MISYKVLIILFVIFAMGYCWPDIVELNLSEQEKKPEMLECMNTLLAIGFVGNIGFLNYSLLKQFDDFKEYRTYVVKSIRSNLENVMTSLDTGYLKEFYDKIRETTFLIKIEKPGEYCERQNTDFLCRKAKAGNGRFHFFGFFKKQEDFSVETCTTDITKYELRHKIVEDNLYTATHYEMKTKYSTEKDEIVEKYDENNIYRNVRTSYNLTVLRYPNTGQQVPLQMSDCVKKYFEYQVNIIIKNAEVLPELLPFHLCKSYLKIENENSDVNEGLPIST